MAPMLRDDPAFLRMFEREAGIAARLEHPNLVRTYEVGVADGELFLAMEYVHGAPLSELRARERPPVPITLRILLDAASGLHVFHDLAGVDGTRLELVHQDVTPHNLIVGYDGVSKLLDFGVARIGSVDASRTETVRG
jgi:serine/threonine-protein kinase